MSALAAQDKPPARGPGFGLYNSDNGEFRFYEEREKGITQIFQTWVGAEGGILYGDFNGDGRRDFLALSEFECAGQRYSGVSIYLRQKDGASPVFKRSYEQNFSPGAAAAVGDLDGDGADDFVVAFPFDWGSDLYTCLQAYVTRTDNSEANNRNKDKDDDDDDDGDEHDGDGGGGNCGCGTCGGNHPVSGLEAERIYSVNYFGRYQVQLADFNGDGCHELLLQHTFKWGGQEYEGVEIDQLTLRGNTLAAQRVHAASLQARSRVIVGDFDGDGRADYAATHPFVFGGKGYTAITIRGSGREFEFSTSGSASTYEAVSIHAGNVHANPGQELVAVHAFAWEGVRYEAAETFRLEGNSGHLALVKQFTVSHPGSIRPGNFDGEHTEELIAYSPNGGQLTIFDPNNEHKNKTAILPGGYKLIAGSGDTGR